MSKIVDFKKHKQKNHNHDQHGKTPQQPPIINLPPLTKYLIILMILVHVVLEWFVSDADHLYMVFNFGYIPAIWTGQSQYAFDINALISPISYIFLHGSWTHLIVNVVMLMAFGAGVEKWMGQRKFLEFFVLCGFMAIVAQTLLFPTSENPVIGASGAESGLFAAILMLLQSKGQLPTGKYGIWPFAALWVGISIVFGLIDGGLTNGSIAWATHLGGFLGGFILLKFRYFKIF